jgi:hypothetical protein
MKKTLIALAVLAASGASFAQSTVTLAGTYNFGFQKADNGAAKADFFDAKINLSGTEDLGGGLKASFLTDIQVGGRQDTSTDAAAAVAAGVAVPKVGNQSKVSGVFGRNATVSLSGGFGTVTGGRVESTNLMQSAQVAGASLADGFDKAGLAGAVSNYNVISYTSPAISGFSANFGQSKALNSDFAPAASVTTNNEVVVTSVGASYVNGPLVAGYVYKNVNTAGTASDGKKNELFATYDAGVAKLGFGYGKNSGARYAGEKATMIYSVVAPMGAFSLGADFATRAAGGTSATVDAKGYAVAANYALSKRTKINATVGKLEGTSLIGQNQFRVGMFHNF